MASACFFVCIFWRSCEKVRIINMFQSTKTHDGGGLLFFIILTFVTGMTTIKTTVTSLEVLNVISIAFRPISQALWCDYIIKYKINLVFWRLHANLHVRCQSLISVMLNAFLVWVSLFHFFTFIIIDVYLM